MVCHGRHLHDMMGNCTDKCSCCDCFCPKLVEKWAKMRPKLLDVLQMEDAAELRLLIDQPSSLPFAKRDSPQDVVPKREKIDGRDSKEFAEMVPLLQQQQQDATVEPEFGCEQKFAASGLQIYVVTWNMNGKIPPSNLARLVDDSNGRYDLYVVGLQEAPSCYVESFFLEVLGENYCLVASSIMSSLQLFVFARVSLLPFISDPRSDRVGVGGLGGVVGRQKGAVAVALRYRELSLLFLSCHLAPHEGNVEARNAQYVRICQSIFARQSTASMCSCLQTTTAAVADDFGLKQQPSTNTVEESDLVVWVGDLNYRVVGHRSSVGVLIKNNLEKLLWPRDQLSREVQQGRVFCGFQEGPLSFRPTYKYDVGTDDYDTSAKERVPSWTDRILFKVKQKGWLSADVHDYNSIDSLKSSDHRPVKALLRVNTVQEKLHYI